MARDFRRAHGYRPRAQIPGWLWFLTGVGTGLLIAFVVYLKRDEIAPPAQTAQTEAPAAIDIPAEPPGVAAPRFDFYTILPDQEIVVPDAESKEPVTIKEAREVKDTKEPREPAPPKAEKPAKAPAPAVGTAPKPAAAKPAPAGKGGYVLQVGSFKRMDEADRLKAALALIGIEATIQVVQLKEGDNWHRVRVGPFEDMARAASVRARLKENKYNSIVLQVRS